MNNNTDTQLYDYTGWIATSVPASMNTDEDLQTSKLAQLVSSSPSLSTNTSTETDTQSNTNLMPTGTSTNVGKVFPWELCPYELRDQIFDALDKCHWQPYFGWDSDGCPPPFLVAVRSLPLSYEHALQRFAQCSSQIHMHLCTSYDLTDMVQAELNVIEKVDLELSDVFCSIRQPVSEQHNPTEYILAKPTWFTTQFLNATNIREVHLRLNLDNNVDQGSMCVFVTEFPFWLEGFKGLSKLTVEIPVVRWIIETNRHSGVVHSMMNRIRKKVGIQGQFVEVVGEKWFEDAEVWVWEATNGRLMDWSQDLGRVWADPDRWGFQSSWGLFYDNDERLGMRDGNLVMQGWDDEYTE